MREYDDVTLKRVQQAELTILKDFMEICDRHGLDYFGIAGTGIGALRHQGFIPWDDDVDLCVWKKDIPAMKAALKKHLPDYYRVIEPADLAPNFYDFVLRVQDLRHH